MKPQLNIQRLKEKREEKGWSKNFAAQKMGFLQSVYLRYENGERAPSYAAIKSMALCLDTSVDYLTGVSNDDAPQEILLDYSDSRLLYIVKSFNSCPEEKKERLFNYAKKIASTQGVTKAEFATELQKGIDSIKKGRTHSTNDVDKMLADEFGI